MDLHVLPIPIPTPASLPIPSLWISFESVLMRWMKLEPIIQSEVSQKEIPIQYTNAYIGNLERW